MKRFNQNRRQVNGTGESNVRPSFLSKPAQRHYTKAGAAILAVIVLHFVSQFIFFQNEKLSPEIEALSQQSVEIKAENEPDVEIETESGAKKPEVAEVPDAAVSPTVQSEPKIIAPSRIVKKKETRETKAERLRRAEKFLTGI